MSTEITKSLSDFNYKEILFINHILEGISSEFRDILKTGALKQNMETPYGKTVIERKIKKEKIEEIRSSPILNTVFDIQKKIADTVSLLHETIPDECNEFETLCKSPVNITSNDVINDNEMSPDNNSFIETLSKLRDSLRNLADEIRNRETDDDDDDDE